MTWGPTDKGKRRPVRIGKYEVLAHVATGGMGAIYRALDTESGRQVALKVLSPDMAAKPVVVQRFQLEARNAAKLRHENIVAHYDYGEVNGTYYLAQEFVEGVDLHDYVSQRGRLGPDEAREIIIQAARALDHAYQKGIVHRDIKPSNLLIAQQGNRPVVKLTDMGLAREIEDQDFRLTRAGTTVGTLDYMAPEQARDSRAADSRSDIYSLGCTFYFALAGHPPFPKGTIAEKLTAHAEVEPPDIRLENPAVGPGLAALLERMLAKRPEDRFQTPAELLAALADPEAWAHEFFKEPGLVPLDEEAPAVPQITAPAGPERPVSEKKPARPALLKSPFGATGASRTPPRPGTRSRRQRPRRSSRRRRWWPWIVAPAGVGAALAMALLMWGGDRFSGRDNASRSGERQSLEQHSGGLRPPLGGVSLPLRGLTPSATNRQFAERQPSKAGGPTPRLFQPVYPTPFGPTAAEVRKEFEGPLATLSADMGDVPIFRVSRLPGGGPNAFPSLAAAAAKAPAGGKAIIEIHDNGPFFEPALPDLVGCRLLIRAGKGYRPLLAWDTGAVAAANKSTPPTHLLALEKGSLVLEDLDVVVKWTGPSANRPAALFCIKDGDLIARRCTFSVAGKHSHGVAVAWLEGTSACRARLSHCYARGGNLVLLHLQSPGGDVLIDDCLAAGGVRPLCAVRGVEEAPATLRWVRSILVCGRTLLHVRPAEETQQRLALKVFCADSLLAQADPAAEGAMVKLAKGTAADRVRWKAINSVYAGWKLLLASAGRNIPATALETDWWALQGYSEGDRALLAPWPAVYPAEPEDAAPAVFNPSGSPAHFAALTSPGLLGCNLAALPAGRPQWLALTWDRPALLLPPLPLGEAPSVPDSADGLYHGEALKLSKAFDLGRHLQSRLVCVRPAPQIVLHLEGSGEVPTSPIHLKGCSLVLAVGAARLGKEPLTLVPAPGSADQEALIQVDGGNLEIIGAHLIFPEKRARAAPRHLIRVRGGKLRLFGCHLRGLLSGGGTYQGLIDLAGPKAACAISDSVLASSGSVLSLHGGGQLRLHQSLALAADDLLVLDLADAASRSSILCALEHATLAGRRNLIDVQGASGPTITVRAEGNVFLAPFEASGPSTLLRCNRALVTQGRLLWQGANNGFDRRFHSYLTVAGEPPASPQPFATWLRLWGTPGERDPLLLELPKTPFRLSPLRLRQLALPRTARLRPGQAPPGADFARLGLTVGRK
jgi:serine/threonine protein kinase